MKRISKAATDLGIIGKRVSPDQTQQWINFQLLHRSYIEKMNKNPVAQPPLDWDFYGKNVNPKLKCMVDEFKSKYEALKVPYPKDTQTAEIEKQATEGRKEIDEFVKESKKRAELYACEKSYLEGVLPFDKMTLEDFADAFPDSALNPKRPTFWPHDE